MASANLREALRPGNRTVMPDHFSEEMPSNRAIRRPKKSEPWIMI
jgi:hypothetical protein